MVTRMRIQKRTRRMKTMMENTNLVPATMKTKVVRVAMPSTKRIWFLNPPSSPRLESSLCVQDVIICPHWGGFNFLNIQYLSRMSLLKNSCPIFW